MSKRHRRLANLSAEAFAATSALLRMHNASAASVAKVREERRPADVGPLKLCSDSWEVELLWESPSGAFASALILLGSGGDVKKQALLWRSHAEGYVADEWGRVGADSLRRSADFARFVQRFKP